MNFKIPDGLFTEREFRKLNRIKARGTGWSILQRHVKNGRVELVTTKDRTKVYRIAGLFQPRTIFRRQHICPPRDLGYIYMLMGYDMWGQGGGGEPA